LHDSRKRVCLSALKVTEFEVKICPDMSKFVKVPALAGSHTSTVRYTHADEAALERLNFIPTSSLADQFGKRRNSVGELARIAVLLAGEVAEDFEKRSTTDSTPIPANRRGQDQR